MAGSTLRRRLRGPRTSGRTTLSQPAHNVRLQQPQVHGSEVLFRWELSPASELYRRTEFRVAFPEQLDLRRVPIALWWRIEMLFLHTHWALLRPCRVELPVSLDAAEREFWLRLIDNVAVQIEAYGGTRTSGRAVELVDDGPPIPPIRLPMLTLRPAVAFSGGKDSLVLSALLSELGHPPLLVMITSPVSWAHDHDGSARQRARTEMRKRLGVETIEVHSDYRTAWSLEFSARQGCQLGVHELSDLCLYHGTMAAVAAASGIERMFMASEADLQYNAADHDDRIVLHREFLSCAVTQAAIDALFSRFGLRQSSLTYPLHMPQVQSLLLHRYADLTDLQCSCWRAPPDAQACNGCVKCFQAAIVSIAEGISPRAIGLDPVKVLQAFGDWRLTSPRAGPALHATRTPRDHTVRCLQAVSLEAARAILAEGPSGDDEAELREALAVYARLRAEALTQVVPPAPGYVAGFLGLVPPDLRAPLRGIFDEHFESAPTHEFAAIVQRSRTLSDWIAQPLRRSNA